jgi:hypothetical protein|nr:MAG TPA: hypothetical protein [Caudoviricetes sp.]
MKMAKYVLPDPKDRSENDPCIIMDTKKVLGFIIKPTKKKKCKRLCQKFKNGLLKKQRITDGTMQGSLVVNVFWKINLVNNY